MSDNNRYASPFVVTVGRQFGSGGRELAKALADDLGIDYYDKELLLEAAREAGVSPEFFERSDERFPTFLHGLFSFTSGITPMCYYTGSSSITDDGIYKAVSDVILKAASERPFVVVGRTADYILRHHPRVANIFVHAPMETRVARILGRGDARTAREAEALSNRHNKWRADYYNFFTDKVWGHPESYHICIDSSMMSMAGCVGLVKDYLRHRGFLG
ncbi:MAG: cytidylate kinase-like family protein [Duncaniella sp.]|nr:cytidylate kinase-like family protein [Duncaniella sp.]